MFGFSNVQLFQPPWTHRPVEERHGERNIFSPQQLNIGTRQALLLPIQGEKSGSASASAAQHFFRNLSCKQLLFSFLTGFRSDCFVSHFSEC